MDSEEDDLRLTTSSFGDVEIIQMTGNIDLYTTPELKTVFDDLNSKKKHKVLIDLLNVKFIDSSGIGILISQALYLRKKNTALKFINVNAAIVHVFSIGGFTRSFKRYSTREIAMETSWALE